MEGTQGQLCTRLTDSLCGNHANSLAFLHHESCSQVTAVALGAQAVLSFAGEDGTDLDLLYTCALDSLASSLANLFAGSYDEVVIFIQDIVNADATEDTLSQSSDNGIVLLDSTSH